MFKPIGRAVLLASASIVASVLLPVASSAETLRIGGTGMALAAMRSIGDSLTAADPGLRVEVLPSLGTPGGIRALLARDIDIAIAGRPLTPDERAKGVAEAACLTTALVFASSHGAASGITKASLPGLYADPMPSWPDGTPLKVILRSRAGSENPYLIEVVPGMAAALDAAYKRRGMPVGATDQENADLATRTAGSFAVMTLLQIHAERLGLRPLSFDGIAPNADTLASKTYPLPLRVCLVLPAAPSPAAARFVAHVNAPAGTAALRSLGAVAAD